MAFLPKGEEINDYNIVSRRPEHTRPLTLGNCDQKLVAKLLDIPLARQASRSVAPQQVGFIRGRRLQDAAFHGSPGDYCHLGGP